MSIDRQVDLEQLSESDFKSVLDAVSVEVLKLGQEAETKINDLLSRFNIQCKLSISYQVLDASAQLMQELPETVAIPEQPVKKKRVRKKKISN
jgi:hypothetical protein